jgi:hypothetical protein
MHVLDTFNASLLLDLPVRPAAHASPDSPLQHVQNSHRPRLLDVGAGDGTVTAELAPLFGEVLATEVSGPCVRAIRRRGIPCKCTTDLSTLYNDRWDVVVFFSVDHATQCFTIFAWHACMRACGWTRASYVDGCILIVRAPLFVLLNAGLSERTRPL